jgi:hypothetical protein
MAARKHSEKAPTEVQQRRASIIRAWLDFADVSISALGRRVTGSENVVKDILSGKVRQPTQRTLQAIARHIGVPVEILEDTNQPMPQFGYGSEACGHARIRIPEAVIARNERQELDFVPFPGDGVEFRLDKIEHLSLAGASALRVWRVWNETDDGVTTHDRYLADISDRSATRAGLYIAVERLADVVVRARDHLMGDERVIGRICKKV